MKRCVTCDVEKPIEDFHRHKSRPDGRASQCVECGRARYAEMAARRRARMEADPDYAARVRSWGRDYRRRMRDVRYGVEEGTVEALTQIQGGRCAACGRTADEVACAGKSGERLHVDHDHATGFVRGMLCKKCNSALGLVDDDVDRLMALAAYLLGARQAQEAK